jgi:hypothetical protein
MRKHYFTPFEEFSGEVIPLTKIGPRPNSLRLNIKKPKITPYLSMTFYTVNVWVLHKKTPNYFQAQKN